MLLPLSCLFVFAQYIILRPSDAVHFQGIAVEGMVLWIKSLTHLGHSFHCLFFLGGGGWWGVAESRGTWVSLVCFTISLEIVPPFLLHFKLFAHLI